VTTLWAAFATWKLLRRVDEERLLGLLTAFGGDRDRFEQRLRMCGFAK
jgi:hypothetical protein